MAMMFDRFEIQSELSKSETALIYKALDTETNQVVALKTQNLAPLGERAEVFVENLIAEGDKTRDFVSQNIVLLYGAGEIEGQFCAAMEYIQGNSIATMLSRKEGFSIWDLLDIIRQVCAGLEYAASKDVTHCSLEPAKIMVQWDGMVKILGYGISTMSLIEAESGKGLGRLMPYCSPEQIRGEAIDLRSNLYTLGAILYEMVAGRQVFDAADSATLVNCIENEIPADPCALNSKIQPAVSALIMKALAKSPAERYQNARELLDDLEKCKENGKKATDAKKAVTAPNVAVSSAARAAAASKFVSAASSATRLQSSGQSELPRAASSTPARVGTPVHSEAAAAATAPSRVNPAAAGVAKGITSERDTKSYSDSESDPTGARLISDFEISAPESDAAGVVASHVASHDTTYAANSPVLSTAAVEQKLEAPRMAVDPMMCEPEAASSGRSFSEAEMPPLKEPIFVSPPAATEPAELSGAVPQIQSKKEEKPKVQVREVAEKALGHVATMPPRLMLFSILGAVAVILVVALAVLFHVRSEDDGSTVAPRPTKAVKATQAVVQTPLPPRVEQPVPVPAPPLEAQPTLTVRPVEKRSTKNSRREAASAPSPVPVVIPGQTLIDSSPQGAQFQVDGKNDPAWVTPFTLADLSPGKHIISASKSGYSSEIRSLDVAAGSKSSLLLHLLPMNALVVVNSTPPGATVVIDGKPTAKVTPAQFAVEKGSHTVLLRKPGFLDETVTADLGPAQNFQYAPILRALGNTEDMRTVGKLNKLFGHGGDNTIGMGQISIHTQPKGAQVAINQHLLDKGSPVEVMLGPGNYVVDVTLTGFKPIRKVVNVDKGGKVAIDEILDRQ